MSTLPMPVICDCGFATMDSKDALKHILQCHPEEYYCPKCGQAWIVHNGDGSCINDEEVDHEL